MLTYVHFHRHKNCEFLAMASVNANTANSPGPAREPNLPLDLIARVLEWLDPNERMLNGRLVSKEACEHLTRLRHCTARLCVPMPAQALEPAWQPHLLRALRLLTFQSKLNMLCVAASTGSEVNMQLAWGLLRPSVMMNFHRLCEDTAPAAIKAGHAHLLPLMLQQHIPVSIDDALVAAAEHSDLAGLQWVWELLGGLLDPPGSFSPPEKFAMIRLAGRSACDSVSKVSWMLDTMGEDEVLQQHMQEVFVIAAEGAAAAGNLPVLRLLLELGMDLPSVAYGGSHGGHMLYPVPYPRLAPWCVVLTAALQGGHVAVADWLVDEAGCSLPPPPPPQQQQQQQEQAEREVQYMWEGAAKGGSVEAFRWLLRHEVPVQGLAMEAAAREGHLEAVQFLHRECGVPLTGEVFRAAAGSGSMPTATWLLQAGCPVGWNLCGCAARAGHLDMVRWLALETGRPWGRTTLAGLARRWDSWSGGGNMDEGAVHTLRALVEAGCPPCADCDDLDSLAESGHLPLMRYLHEELGAQFGPRTLAAAAEGGCEPLIEWVVRMGCVQGEDVEFDPYVMAGRYGDMATMACLRRLGVPWHAWVLLWAVQTQEVSLDVLRWMVEQGAPWDRMAVAEAVDFVYGRQSESESFAWLKARLDHDRQSAVRGRRVSW